MLETVAGARSWRLEIPQWKTANLATPSAEKSMELRVGRDTYPLQWWTIWVRWQGDTCQLYDFCNLWWPLICLCFSNFSLPYFTTPGPFSAWILYWPAQRKNERVRSCSADFFGTSFERFSSSLPTSLNGVKQCNVNLPIQGLPFPPQKKPPRLHVFQLGPWAELRWVHVGYLSVLILCPKGFQFYTNFWSVRTPKP